MPSRCWVYWLAAIGAGACVALGAGHGVAAADTDPTEGADSTSGPAQSDTSRASGESPTRNPDSDRRSAGSTDPASVPASVDDPDVEDVEQSAVAEPQRRTSRDRSTRVITLEGEATATDQGTAPDMAADDDPEALVEIARQPDESAASTATVQTAAKPAAAARTPGPVKTAVLNVLSALGWSARPEAAAFPALAPWAATTTATPHASTSAQAAPITAGSTPVTGVQTGRAALTIPIGPDGYTTRADWYLPTQADGSVSATGVIWLQHGFLNDKSFLAALAKTLSRRANSIVVAPNLPSFPLGCSGCWLNGVEMQQAVATMFLGDRASLNASAIAAGFEGTLPQDFILSGQSAGGGFAAATGGYYATDPATEDDLRGVVMFDGVAFSGVLRDAVDRLDSLAIPAYQVAAPPQAWNSSGATTKELVAARPGHFVGATLAGGSHADSLVGAGPIIDFFTQLAAGFSPAGNTAAVYTLATGWINDLYQGLGPADGNGIYGAPDQYIVVGDAAAVVLGPAPVVDVDSFLGTWYEVGSVKQFFSIGLVNTKAVYSANPDRSIRVENSGNYFVDNGPKSTIVGAALPVDATNNKLNVTFFGPASSRPPGNYWIVDLDRDYQWAIVSDSTGLGGFLLSRTPVTSADFYQQLLDRASVKGVKGWITRTRQSAAVPASVSV